MIVSREPFRDVVYVVLCARMCVSVRVLLCARMCVLDVCMRERVYVYACARLNISCSSNQWSSNQYACCLKTWSYIS